MKRYVALFLTLILLAGCGRKAVAPEPQTISGITPDELAGKAWAALSDSPQPRAAELEETCLLLDLKEEDLVQAYVFLELEDMDGDQLFLLQAAPERTEKVLKALQTRLELVRQTGASWLGEENSAAQYGCVCGAGRWCALLVPGDPEQGAEKTDKAREIIQKAFEQDF